MKLQFLKTIILGAVLSISTVANAGLINGGFESGLTNWDYNSPSSATIVNSHEGLSAMEGNSFLKLLGDTSGNGINNTATQSFYLNVGDSIQGFAAFDWNDYNPYYDFSSVEIFDHNDISLAVLWSETGVGLSNYANTPWDFWQYTALASNTYKLVLSSGNTADSVNSSIALFDAISTTTSVPEPSTLAIFALGIIGLASRRFAKK